MKEILSLDGEWQFNWDSNLGAEQPLAPEAATAGWLTGQVPGSAHSDLLRNGRILDPYVDRQAEAARWVEQETFYYRRAFAVPAEWAGKRIFLESDGLDCFATLSIDGQQVGSSENAFIEQRFDVTGFVRAGRVQDLLVRLESPIGAVAENMRTTPVKTSFLPDCIYARRPAFSYGWDFAARIVGCGIWRPIRLVAVEPLWLEAAWLWTENIEESAAQVRVEVELGQAAQPDGEWGVEIELARGEQLVTARASVAESAREGKIQFPLRVENPALWFPHTHGEPNLYELRVRLTRDGQVADALTRQVGLRTVRLNQEPRGEGKTRFIVEINGQKVFCKGGNWVPGDSMRFDSSPAKYRRLLEMARDGQMNMLRVWGGGIYESEEFYGLCDQLGILVWQDFMFACNQYPDHDPAYLANVQGEAGKAIRRLRSHPSIALWCGNNENDWGWSAWGWQKMNDRFYGEKIYHEVLPQACAALDPSRPYWPSSPFGGAQPNSDAAGDIHDWRVWHEKQPPEHYATWQGAFVSEFGMQASPNLATVKRMLTAPFRWPIGSMWKAHHRIPAKMNPYLRQFGKPANVHEYVQLSQMVQAHTLSTGVEIYRRRLWDCSGSLVWQFNEPWPTHCWSIIDHEGRPKGAYFALRRAYQNPMVCFEKLEKSLRVWLVNDSREEIHGTLEIRCQGFDGALTHQERIDVQLGQESSQSFEVALPRQRLAFERQSFWGARFAGAGVECERAWFAQPHARLQWPKAGLEASVSATEAGRELVLRASAYARWVELSTPEGGLDFADNYFELWPDEEKRILLPADLEARWVIVQAWNQPEPLRIALA